MNNRFHAFQHKQIISPYKYDLENTPIIQIMCDKIGSTVIDKVIGVYNLNDSKTTPNKIEFPIISKLSTLSFSLRRQELSEGDDKNEEIYYQWNGMEHTLVLSIEYIDILPVSFESGIILS